MPMDHQEEPIMNGLESDASSVDETEPVSPPNEADRSGVFIRDMDEKRTPGMRHTQSPESVKPTVSVA